MTGGFSRSPARYLRTEQWPEPRTRVQEIVGCDAIARCRQFITLKAKPSKAYYPGAAEAAVVVWL